ncbi:MAG: M56 family metallopeptidase [Oscillospiraceae bacterium]|nr:M56 family metallopeptidase [Oscillospiraceae bacterium]
MESLFLSLWNRSIAAGWLILAIIVLRLVLRKAPKSIRCWLWALAGLRLVLPRFGESPLSLIPSAETVPQAVFTRDALQVVSGVAAFNSAVNEHLVDYYETASLPAGHTRSFVLTCAAVWLVGMALLALWTLASYLCLRRRVVEAVRSEDGVWVCDRIDSPFLLGLFRPRIYLPVGLDGDSRGYVLAHERAHIRRRDYLIKPLALLLLTVYWFNPLVWAAYVLLCRDIELACDERVIAGLGTECKKPYSAALLQYSVHRGGLTALAFGEVGVKERVKNVLNYKKPAFWVVIACAAVLTAVGVCFLTDPVKAPPEESSVSFTNLGASQPEKPEVFAAGALLFQNPSLNYRPVDGCHRNPILYGGDTLTLTKGYPGMPTTYKLTETVTMGWDNLYDYFPLLKETEELYGAYLTGHNDLAITARFYEQDHSKSASATDARNISIWTIQKENGGQRWWLYDDDGRLYALIRPDDAFPFMANGVLWTYMPGTSNVLSVRFDLESGAEVYADPGGSLSPSFEDMREGRWTDRLTVEPGQTIYWKPTPDEDGKPMTNTGLRYSYVLDLPVMNAPYQGKEELSLRPAMDYAGLEDGITYGVSNNWLGAASSQTHFTFLGADPETGDLVVGAYAGGGPYLTRAAETEIESVPGVSGLSIYDLQEVQPYPAN